MEEVYTFYGIGGITQAGRKLQFVARKNVLGPLRHLWRLNDKPFQSAGGRHYSTCQEVVGTTGAAKIEHVYPYSDTYMSMLCNTTSCGHLKHLLPWSLAPARLPFCRGKCWQYTQVSL